MAVSIPLSPESFPPSCAAIHLFHTLSFSLSFFLPLRYSFFSILPAPHHPTSSSSFPLSLSPSPTPPLDSAFVCPLPSNLCLVWQSGGFVVMTTNPGNPATLSHPSSHLPSPSLFPLLPPITPILSPVYPPPQSAAASSHPRIHVLSRVCVRVSVFLRVYPLRIVRTPTPPPECKNDDAAAAAGVASARALRLCRLPPRFIHLLHILLPGCCTPAQPGSLAEGGRCTQPCATPGRMCVLEERDLRCLPAPRPPPRWKYRADRAPADRGGKKRKKEGKGRRRKRKMRRRKKKRGIVEDRTRPRSKFGGRVARSRMRMLLREGRGSWPIVDTLSCSFFFLFFFLRASIVSLLCFSGMGMLEIIKDYRSRIDFWKGRLLSFFYCFEDFFFLTLD